MAIRFPHVLLMMGLVLLAGVLGVRHFETRMGGATVPGIVLLDLPWLAVADAERLSSHWPGARIETVTGGTDLLAPFEDELIARLGQRGDRTAAFSVGRAVPEPYLVVLDGFTGTAAAVDGAATFVRAQTGTRAFLATILGDAQRPDASVVDLVETLVGAFEALPSFRRTAVVLLGPRAGTTRLSVRLDFGRWVNRARPELADLLDTRW